MGDLGLTKHQMRRMRSARQELVTAAGSSDRWRTHLVKSLDRFTTLFSDDVLADVLDSSTGAKIQFTPMARASCAVILPSTSAQCSDPVAPIAIFQGKDTVLRMRKLAPLSKSEAMRRGNFDKACILSIKIADSSNGGRVNRFSIPLCPPRLSR